MNSTRRYGRNWQASIVRPALVAAALSGWLFAGPSGAYGADRYATPVVIAVNDTVNQSATDMRDLASAFIPFTLSTVTVSDSIPGEPQITPAIAGDVFVVVSLSTGTPQPFGTMEGGASTASSFGTFTQSVSPADLTLTTNSGASVAAQHIGPTAGALFAGTYYFEVAPTFESGTLAIKIGTLGPDFFNDGSGQAASATVGDPPPFSIAVPVSASPASSSSAAGHKVPPARQQHHQTHSARVGSGGGLAWGLLAPFLAALLAASGALYWMRRRPSFKPVTRPPVPIPGHLRIGDLGQYLPAPIIVARIDGPQDFPVGEEGWPTSTVPIALPPAGPTGGNVGTVVTTQQALIDSPIATATAGDAPARPVRFDTEADHETVIDASQVPLIEALVLGTVQVNGFARPPQRAAVTEVVCHLALMSKHSFSLASLTTSLWADREDAPSEKTLKNYLCQAREALPSGVLADGRSGGYLLNARVESDWRRFASLVTAAEVAPEAQVRSLFAEALAMVRGVPFSSPKGARGSAYEWASASGLTYEIVATIESAAHRLATLSAEAGDCDGLAFAIERGLIAVPTSRVLLSDLLRTAATREAVEAAWGRVRSVLRRDARELGPLYKSVAGRFQ